VGIVEVVTVGLVRVADGVTVVSMGVGEVARLGVLAARVLTRSGVGVLAGVLGLAGAAA
jgi:hypothetical protein